MSVVRTLKRVRKSDFDPVLFTGDVVGLVVGVFAVALLVGSVARLF